MNQMIGSSYGIVPIWFYTFDGVFILKFMLILHYFEDLLIIGHFLFAWKEAADAFFFWNFEPRMCSDVLYRVACLRVCV